MTWIFRCSVQEWEFCTVRRGNGCLMRQAVPVLPIMPYPTSGMSRVSTLCIAWQLSRTTDVTYICTGPAHLNFVTTLNAVSNYLNETWGAKWQRHTIGSLGQAIVILAPLTQFSESDQQTNLKLLKEIKRLHPGNKTHAFLLSYPFTIFRNRTRYNSKLLVLPLFFDHRERV